MAAANYNLVIEKGTTFKQRFIWTQKTTGEPVNLTGYTAKMQIRPSEKNNKIIIELSTENSRIVLTEAEGIIDLVLEDEDTVSLSDTEGVYDLLLTASNGDVVKLVRGKATLHDVVTRNA